MSTKESTKKETKSNVSAPSKGNFDLSKITIDRSKNAVEVNEIISNASSQVSSSFQITLLNSGYSVKVTPLRYRDMLKMIDENLSNWESKRQIYLTIYSHIVWDGDYKPTFTEFLKITSIRDLNTLYYGLFCATYPKLNEYSAVCTNKNCRKDFTVKLPASSLIQTYGKRDEMSKLSKEIANNAINLEEIKKFSNVLSDPIGVETPYSKFVFSLKNPSLLDLSELVRQHDDDIADRDSWIVTMIMSTVCIYVPTKDGKYVEVRDFDGISKLIDELAPEDVDVLKNTLSSMSTERFLMYGLKDVVCPHCKEKIGFIPINIEDVLFQRLYEVAS